MNIRTVIFDFDGTLANTREMIWSILQQVAPVCGVPSLSRADFDAARGFRGGLAGKELRKKYGLSWLNIMKILKRVRDAQQRMASEIPLPAGMAETLSALHTRGIRLGILTTNRTATAQKFVAHHNLPPFDCIVSASDIFGKTGALKRLLRREKIDPRLAVMVGDEAGDIIAGKKAGLRTVAVTWGFYAKELLQAACPDAIVDSAALLKGELGKLNTL